MRLQQVSGGYRHQHRERVMNNPCSSSSWLPHELHHQYHQTVLFVRNMRTYSKQHHPTVLDRGHGYSNSLTLCRGSMLDPRETGNFRVIHDSRYITYTRGKYPIIIFPLTILDKEVHSIGTQPTCCTSYEHQLWTVPTMRWPTVWLELIKMA